MEVKDVPSVRAFAPTIATTVDEIVKAAYFVATGIDAPVVEVVNPHVINLHYAADGSLATVKVEGRPGAWGGIQPKLVDQTQIDAANAHYDEMKAAAAPPPPEGGVLSKKEEKKEVEEKKGPEHHRNWK